MITMMMKMMMVMMIVMMVMSKVAANLTFNATVDHRKYLCSECGTSRAGRPLKPSSSP